MNELKWAEILCAAVGQSALESGCAPADFFRQEHVVVRSRADMGARKYLELPFALDLTSYGNNVVASADEAIIPVAKAYLRGRRTEACFETPALHELDAMLASFGLKTFFQAEYFLPDPAAMRGRPCACPTRVLTRECFPELYLPQWSNALCAARKENDVLCVGAYDGDMLIGLAGCSTDCERMWQIGIDVLPAYRKKGIAAALVSRLAAETFSRGKIPFYCAAWSNLASKNTALACGFRPAWVQLTAKPVASSV